MAAALNFKLPIDEDGRPARTDVSRCSDPPTASVPPRSTTKEAGSRARIFIPLRCCVTNTDFVVDCHSKERRPGVTNPNMTVFESEAVGPNAEGRG